MNSEEIQQKKKGAPLQLATDWKGMNQKEYVFLKGGCLKSYVQTKVTLRISEK